MRTNRFATILIAVALSLLSAATLSAQINENAPRTCVVTSLGSECAETEQRPVSGDCRLSDGTLTYCLVAPEDIPMYASWYSHELCLEEFGGHSINCDSDPYNKALRPSNVDDYGSAAACPHDWLGMTFITPFGTYLCDDRGPAIKLGFREIWEAGPGKHWAWTIDFYLDPRLERPDWVYTRIEDWTYAPQD